MFETVVNEAYALTDQFRLGQSIYQTQTQNDAHVAALAGGGFIAVWTGEDGYNDYGIRAQLFDNDGNRLSDEFGINSATSGVQSESAVAALTNGGFVVTWLDQSDGSSHVHGQMFDPLGDRVGSEFIADSAGNGAADSDVRALAGGGFVVVWDAGTDICAQVFASDATKIGPQFVASDSHPGDKASPTVTVLSDGNFVVSWFDWAADSDSSPGSKAQLFDASGSKIGDSFSLNSYVTGYQQNPTVTALPSGGFVAAYADTGIDNLNNPTGHGGIWIQIFDASGHTVGGEVRASQTAVEAQYLPVVQVVPGTGFLVAWRDGSGSGVYDEATAIHAQMFDFNGHVLGTEFSLNQLPGESQNEPALAYLSNGALVVGFDELDGPSYNDQEAAARMLFPVVHGTDGDDRFEGTSGRDFYIGGAGDDVIHGGAGRDQLDGGSGNDFLDGGPGTDTLWGETGDDTYVIDTNLDTVVENPGEGIDTVQSPVNYTLPANVENLLLTGGAAVSGRGNSLDNVITGNDSANFLSGFDGNDVVTGGGGDDQLFGGNGNDIVNGGAGNDFIVGNAGADVLTGGPGADRFDDPGSGSLDGDTISDFTSADRITFASFPSDFTFALSGNTLTYSGTNTSGTLTFGSALLGQLVASAAPEGGVQLTLQTHDPANDFNGDGRSDILWRNDDGRMTDWLGLDNGGFFDNAANGATSVPLSWHVAATGDFDGDHRDDILWRNDDGTIADWLGQANGGFFDNGVNGRTFVPNSWHVSGVGDFDGDGRDDILWRNDNGTMADWLGLSNGGFFDNGVNGRTFVPTDWHVAGIGDFDGDGRSDILWRNDDGRMSDWLGLSNGGFFDNAANGSTSVPLSWHVAGIGDFNGDGHDDILWRNDDGTIADWLGQPNGGFFDNGIDGRTFVPTSWQVEAIGDYNGDGRDDILWRNEDGTMADWLGQPNGGFFDNGINGRTWVPTDWHPQPVHEVF